MQKTKLASVAKFKDARLNFISDNNNKPISEPNNIE